MENESATSVDIPEKTGSKSKSSDKQRQNLNSTPGISTDEDLKADDARESDMIFKRPNGPELLDNRPLREKLRDMRVLSVVGTPQQKQLRYS